MTKEQLGEFVKQQRMLQNITQKELSERVGCRRQALIEIENAQCEYGVSVIISVLNSLGFMLVPTVCSTALPTYNFLNFAKIKSAEEKDDPSLQERKKERIFAQSNRKHKNQQNEKSSI